MFSKAEPVSLIDAANDRERVWGLLDRVADPELPAVSITELGMVRFVRLPGPIVGLSPTYSACPAVDWISSEVITLLASAGYGNARVVQVLTPAWNTGWISPDGLHKLACNGIAPPQPRNNRPSVCPQCGATQIEQISEFGATPCKSLYRCQVCREPFEYFKCL